MRGLSTFAVTLAAATTVSGCASLGAVDAASGERVLSWADVQESGGAEIVAERPAPAPAGLIAFCARMPSTCEVYDGAGNAPAPSGAPLHHPAAWAPSQATHSTWSALAGEDGAAIFSRLLAARAREPVSHYERHGMGLTELRWRELRSVNRQINREITAVTDESNYQVSEYWAMPLTERSPSGEIPKGDCEDFALEKRARLIALGWNEDALSLAVAYSTETGLHAVLIAETDHGDFVLDNLHDEPVSPQNLNYTWVSRQAGGAMTNWASAQLEILPAPGGEQRLLQASAGNVSNEYVGKAPRPAATLLSQSEPRAKKPTPDEQPGEWAATEPMSQEPGDRLTDVVLFY